MTQYEHYILSVADKTIPVFNKGIREDGTIDDTQVETYFCPIETIWYDKEEEFIRLQADNGITDVELRLTFDELDNLIKQIRSNK